MTQFPPTAKAVGGEREGIGGCRPDTSRVTHIPGTTELRCQMDGLQFGGDSPK